MRLLYLTTKADFLLLSFSGLKLKFSRLADPTFETAFADQFFRTYSKSYTFD